MALKLALLGNSLAECCAYRYGIIILSFTQILYNMETKCNLDIQYLKYINDYASDWVLNLIKEQLKLVIMTRLGVIRVKSCNIGDTYAVAASLCGRYIAVGLGDNNVRWLRLDPVPHWLPAVAAHTGIVYSVAFSPCSCYLVSGSGDQTVVVWQRQGDGWFPCQRLVGHTSHIFSVLFLSSHMFVSGSGDQSVRVWRLELASWVCIQVLTGGFGSVYSLVGGDKFLVSSHLGLGQVWGEYDGKWRSVGTLSVGSSCVPSLAISPSGSSIIAGGYGDIEVWKMKQGQWQFSKTLSSSYGMSTIYSIAYSPCERYIVACSVSDSGSGSDVVVWRKFPKRWCPIQIVRGSDLVRTVAIVGSYLVVGMVQGLRLYQLITDQVWALFGARDVYVLYACMCKDETAIVQALTDEDGLNCSSNPRRLLQQKLDIMK